MQETKSLQIHAVFFPLSSKQRSKFFRDTQTAGRSSQRRSWFWVWAKFIWFRGDLLHLLFLICGMHGLKPFNILWMYWLLQILWYLSYFEVGFWFCLIPPVNVRGVRGDCGVYEVSIGTWHTFCLAVLLAESALWADLEQNTPVWIFGISLGMW